MYDVISLGSATVDAFAYTRRTQLITRNCCGSIKDLIAYPVGSKILIEKLNFYVGGGGTNTAVAFSRMGLKAAYLGNLGKDGNGDRVIEELKKDKVDFIGTRSNHRTNYSVILDSLEHDRTILAYKEASEFLKLNSIKKNKLKTRWFYFASSIGESLSTQKKLVDYAKKNNIKIAFNPSNYETEKGVRFIHKILEDTEVLILNKEEAELLVGKGTPKKTLKTLTMLGPKTVIITNGNDPLQCCHDGMHYIAYPLKIKPLESTGAGDAFASTFIGALIKGKKIEDALRLGVTNAQSVISHFGAKNNLLSWSKLLKESKRRFVKVTKSKL